MTPIAWIKQEIRSHEDHEVRIDLLAALLVFVNDEHVRRFLNAAHWVYCEAHRRSVAEVANKSVGRKSKRARVVEAQDPAGCEALDGNTNQE